MTLARSTFVLGVVAALAVAGCDDTQWIVPQPTKDAPTFKVSNYVIGGSGRVDKELSTASEKVNATGFTQLMEMVTASQPIAGIHSLHVEIGTPIGTMYTADTVVNARSDGKVPAALSALGHNGAGGVGSIPMSFTMWSSYWLKATATTFNRISATIELQFKPWGVVSATLSQSKQSDGSTILAWDTSFADGLPTLVPSVPVFVGNSGSTPVTPATTTTYTLTASNPFGMATDSETVQGTDLHALTVTYVGPPWTTQAGGTPVDAVFNIFGSAQATVGPGLTSISDLMVPAHFNSDEPWTITRTYKNLRSGPWAVTVHAVNQSTHDCYPTVPGSLKVDARPTATTPCGY